MSKIRIKNVGPIADTGEIVMSAVMLIVGKQSSGKSTFMKILCFCRWIEKKNMLDGENLLKKYTHYGRFLKELKKFHRFDDAFFGTDSQIIYDTFIPVCYTSIHGTVYYSYAGKQKRKILLLP